MSHAGILESAFSPDIDHDSVAVLGEGSICLLYTSATGCTLPQQFLIVAGNNDSLVCNNNRSILLGAIAV